MAQSTEALRQALSSALQGVQAWHILLAPSWLQKLPPQADTHALPQKHAFRSAKALTLPWS